MGSSRSCHARNGRPIGGSGKDFCPNENAAAQPPKRQSSNTRGSLRCHAHAGLQHGATAATKVEVNAKVACVGRHVDPKLSSKDAPKSS
ncbi:MAG: hypothetical protein GY772_00715 [bacterium]|nr:hypothetical protein [bacterium]